MQEDKQLIEEIMLGSCGAMEVLVKKHYKAVFSYVYRNLGDYHTAYDLTQEVFVKMLKALKLYDMDKGDFSHWLLKIAVNTCKDYYKGSYYRYVADSTELDDSRYQDINVTDFLLNREETQVVKNAVMQLPQHQKEAIILRFFHDMKISDISKATEANEATVKSRIRQGLAKLKGILLEGEDCYGKKQVQK